MRVARAVVLAGALAGATVVASADPASAHGVGGVQPSNYETRVLSITPHVTGIEVAVVDLGARLELTNHTGRDMIVLGYDDEPYLRVGPRGTFENVRSPAVYLNRTRYATDPVPKFANSNAFPQWRRVSTSTAARWHDHRAHWMSHDDPPAVQRDPGARHLVQRWTVQLEERHRVFRVHGDVLWVPGPSPWPWVLGAVGLVAALLAVVGSRYARVTVMVALGLLVVSESAHVAGAWGGTTASGITKLAASGYSLGGVALAVVALAWVVRSGLYAAAPLVLLAGLFVPRPPRAGSRDSRSRWRSGSEAASPWWQHSRFVPPGRGAPRSSGLPSRVPVPCSRGTRARASRARCRTAT